MSDRARLHPLGFVTALACLAACDAADDPATPAVADAGSDAGAAEADSGGTAGDASTEADVPAEPPSPEFDPQVPPADSDKIERWLEAGYYKSWHCEPKPTTKKQGAPVIHAHGAGSSRVCSNDLLAASTAAAVREFPKYVASVKELYGGSGKLTGAAVAVKLADDSDSGKAWYWWEGARHAGMGLDGCTGCHGAAGSDSDHPGAGDYVYFQVTAPPPP